MEWLLPELYHNPTMTTEEWWKFHWRLYCKGFILSLCICYFGERLITGRWVGYWFSGVITPAEFNQLFYWIPLVGYGFCFSLSQLVYWIASWAEERLQPDDISRYRRTAFWITYWISLVLPFLVLLVIHEKAEPLLQRMIESQFHVIKPY